MSATIDTVVSVDTPARLNRWQALGTVLLVLFGLAAAALHLLDHAADGRAADDTEQLVRVQEVQSSLLRADALATTALLTGDTRAPDEDTEYDAAVDAALTGITDAAEAQSADREELAALNVAVNDYVTAVAESSGADALARASADLRSDALPLLTALVSDNTERAEESMTGPRPFALVGVGVVTVLGLGWLHRRLAHTFRRHLNGGVALAVVLVAVTTAGTAALAFDGAGDRDDLREGDFRTAVGQAAARTAANDAQASESRRLVRGGAGESLEQAWQESADVVSSRGSPSIAPLWETYAERHEQVVTRLGSGDRDAAVDAATADDGSNAALDAYDEAAQRVTTEAAAAVTDDLRGGRWVDLVLAVAMLLAAGGAVALLGRGIGVRRREFA